MAMNIAMKVLIEEAQKQAAALKTEREKQERNNCINCGEPIKDWEETLLTENELILTYRCSCGCYAEQHFTLTYDRTEEIEQ